MHSERMHSASHYHLMWDSNVAPIAKGWNMHDFGSFETISQFSFSTFQRALGSINSPNMESQKRASS
jgi:hypothetical protein